MNADAWFLFCEWFDSLEDPRLCFASNVKHPQLTVVDTNMELYFTEALRLKIVERFDWLSREMLQIVKTYQEFAEEARQEERNSILRAANARRLADSEKHGPLFRTRRAKWEHDTELSRLERQTETLEYERSERIMRQEQAKRKRQELFETLEKLPYAQQIRVCSNGAFRYTGFGEIIWQKLKRVGLERTQGWQLQEILTIGQLLAR